MYPFSQPTFTFPLEGWHDRRLKLISTPATDKDFEQDKGVHKFGLDSIRSDFPLFRQRYGREEPEDGDKGDPELKRLPTTEPGVRCSVGLYETPIKNQGDTAHQHHTSGYYIAQHLEAGLAEEARERFDTRFVDLVCDKVEDSVLFKAMEQVAQWIQDGSCEQFEEFLALYEPKTTERKRADRGKHAESEKRAKSKKPHEDNVTRILVKAFDAIGTKLIECLKACEPFVDRDKAAAHSHDQAAFASTGTVPLRPGKEVPMDSVDRLKTNKPDFVGRKKSTLNRSLASGDRGTKRKGEQIGLYASNSALAYLPLSISW
jgi:hypothetical protein